MTSVKQAILAAILTTKNREKAAHDMIEKNQTPGGGALRPDDRSEHGEALKNAVYFTIHSQWFEQYRPFLISVQLTAGDIEA